MSLGLAATDKKENLDSLYEVFVFSYKQHVYCCFALSVRTVIHMEEMKENLKLHVSETPKLPDLYKSKYGLDTVNDTFSIPFVSFASCIRLHHLLLCRSSST